MKLHVNKAYYLNLQINMHQAARMAAKPSALWTLDSQRSPGMGFEEDFNMG